MSVTGRQSASPESSLSPHVRTTGHHHTGSTTLGEHRDLPVELELRTSNRSRSNSTAAQRPELSPEFATTMRASVSVFPVTSIVLTHWVERDTQLQLIPDNLFPHCQLLCDSAISYALKSYALSQSSAWPDLLIHFDASMCSLYRQGRVKPRWQFGQTRDTYTDFLCTSRTCSSMFSLALNTLLQSVHW